jgi:NAD-dependent deacetylase
MFPVLETAAQIFHLAKRVTVFTGAGISVESGIPPFRGPDGLWTKVSPEIFDIRFFRENPQKAWELLRSRLGETLEQAQPNTAHRIIARLEQTGKVATVITQNIDGLHQRAGSKKVLEFHGSAHNLICLDCAGRIARQDVSLESLPPRCKQCGGILKPDFVFFGESIPEPTRRLSFLEAEKSDCFLLVGTSGEIMPACLIPRLAKQRGAKIIEVNKNPSQYTQTITDVFLQGRATEQMEKLLAQIEAGGRTPI